MPGQIVEAVQQVEAILAVDRIDLPILAPHDLNGPGGPRSFDAPALVAAVAAIERAAAAGGVPLNGSP